MDGVITSESAYWDTAGLVIRDILDSPAYLGLYPPDYTPIAGLYYQRIHRGSRHEWRKYLPSELIKRCKSRGINSNWDLAYMVVGLYITPLFSPFSQILHALMGKTPPLSSDESLDPSQDDISNRHRMKEHLSPIWDDLQYKSKQENWTDLLHLHDFHLWGSWFRERKCAIAPVNKIELRIMDDFHPDVRGVRLLDEINTLIDDDPSFRYPLFGRKTALWEECRDLFQQWYLGEDLYCDTYGCSIPYTPKPGLIHNEEPLNGRVKTHAALTALKRAGYQIGIATGRPRNEILTPLKEWKAVSYFDSERIVTHDEVEEAEKELKRNGITDTLSKPHPYVFLKSIRPELDVMSLYRLSNSPLPGRDKILIVGDAMADIWAAKKIDCPCAALLSGAMGESGRRDMESAHPEIICHDFIELAEALVSVRK